jgi:hypothetical protein
MKGSAQWDTVGMFTGYYIPAQYAKNKKPVPTKFINNTWHSLICIDSQHTFFTHASHCIARINDFGLGYWNLTNPEHPDYTAPKPIIADPPEELSSYGPIASSCPIS